MAEKPGLYSLRTPVCLWQEDDVTMRYCEEMDQVVSPVGEPIAYFMTTEHAEAYCAWMNSQAQPQQFYTLTHTTSHGTDVYLFSSLEKAGAKEDAIKAAYPEDFEEDNAHAWIDIESVTLDA